MLHVNPNQKGNPLLEHFKKTSWNYEEIIPDYLIGKSSGLLFLSLKYHRIHPEYIGTRIPKLESFKLKVLLVLVDITQSQNSIRELTKIAIDSEFMLILAWSQADAAKYIETFKSFENKSPDAIRGKTEDNILAAFNNFMTQIKSVNRTDVLTLSYKYPTVKDFMNANATELKQLPSFGDEKVRQIMRSLDTPFMMTK